MLELAAERPAELARRTPAGERHIGRALAAVEARFRGAGSELPPAGRPAAHAAVRAVERPSSAPSTI